MSGFRMRRGSSTAWTAANPVLGEGEFGLDLNASMFKIGNGVSSWTQLPYYSSGGGGGGGAALSAGTQSASTGTIVFANSNGLTFGMSGSSQITASHNGLTTARASNDGIGLNSAFTAGPLAMTINSSGLSLNAGSAAGTTSGFAGNLISGSMTHNTAGLNLSLNHPAWLTTAAASNHSHGNPTLALTNLSGTTASNSAGLTLSLSAAAPGGGGAALSAGTQSGNTGTIVFSNSNGLTFGMSGSSRITMSHDGIRTLGISGAGGLDNLTASVATIQFDDPIRPTLAGANSIIVSHNAESYYASGNTTLTSSGVGDFAAQHVLDGKGAASVGFSANRLFVSVPTQTNQTLGLYAVSNTTQSSSGTVDARTLSFAGAGIASVGVSNGSVIVSVPAGGGGGDGFNRLAAGTQTAGTNTTVNFANSNGITFGMSGSSQITASHNGVQFIYAGGGTASEAGFGIGLIPQNQRIGITAGPPDEINFEAYAPWVGISNLGNTAGTSGTLSNGDYVLAGHRGIVLSQSTGAGGYTLSVGNQPENYKAVIPLAMLNTQTYSVAQSTSIIWPSDFQNVETVGFARIPLSVGGTSMASLATTINTSLAYSNAATFRLVAYTRGTGASSQSLQSVASTSWSSGMGATLTANTTGSQYSVSHAFSFPASNTAQQTLTTSYAASVTNFQVSSTHLTSLTGAKILAFPWETFFEGDRYWFMLGVSTTSGTTGNASMSNARINTSGLGMSQVNLTWGNFGSANNASVHAVSGIGSFTTAGGGTTASLGFSNISSSASHIIPYLSVAQIV